MKISKKENLAVSLKSIFSPTLKHVSTVQFDDDDDDVVMTRSVLLWGFQHHFLRLLCHRRRLLGLCVLETGVASSIDAWESAIYSTFFKLTVTQ